MMRWRNLKRMLSLCLQVVLCFPSRRNKIKRMTMLKRKHGKKKVMSMIKLLVLTRLILNSRKEWMLIQSSVSGMDLVESRFWQLESKEIQDHVMCVVDLDIMRCNY